MAKFNYQQAKESGYSDDEITDFLSQKNPGFNVKKARESGYSSSEINDFLSSREQKPEAPKEDLGRASAQLGLGALEATGPGLAAQAWKLFGLGKEISSLRYSR